ncbi:iron-sulfur cluster binding protein [Chitinivibrio alkaliphilus ACht1]|uniref:Iron-sulfur cluster binding protein n=2 Tax=Chitinivibrio TaxID=1505231 RepID=U7DA22_9BACT|nr:iron-sulfur cluster binding protein [Chitinivibrio alkaliphilus ACht1]
MALVTGFSACGFVALRRLSEHDSSLQNWLSSGYHGSMGWMENHFEKRLDPRLLVPGAETGIILLLNYFPQKKYDDTGHVLSKYAYGDDYHGVMKQMLFSLRDQINTVVPAKGRAFVDSAPVLERPWAVEAGLGWIGKNSLLIHPVLGSFCFIGELFLSCTLPPDAPWSGSSCGTCNRCRTACPTQAIVSPGCIDSRRCLSYLTIEHRGEIPPDRSLYSRVFGCDLCQDVCPWNRSCTPTTVPEFIPDSLRQDVYEQDLWKRLTPEDFNRLFSSSPLRRTGYTGLTRNIDRCSSQDEDAS